jgi:hypothetical protein
MTSIRYQVGGALLQDVSSYVTRDSDRQLFEALKAGEFCYVLNSRQMGKSSLMVRTLAQLQESGWKGIILDFSAKDTQSDQPNLWYNGIVNQLNNHFKLLDRGDFRAWLKERDFISPVERLGEFIETVLLPGIIEPIIIFVDEIDSTLGLPFTDDFFALIRACYNRRAERPDYKRLTFALLGVAAPSELIGDTKRTPFNIGTSIDLSGFTLAEAQPLAAGLAEKSENPQAVLEAILYWTGGQPFLSQRLCQLVADANDHITASNEASFVEGLVRSRLIENWESQDQQEHLKTIRRRVIENEQKAGYLLELYRQTRQAGSLPVQNRPEEQELQLSGLVVKREGNLQVYNPIYAEVFNELWIDGELAKLRPYAETFRAWIVSGRTDKSRLLRGGALKEAEQWAKEKNPSAEDQDFISASRTQEREEEIAVKEREAELERVTAAREAAEEAERIQFKANQQAQKKIRRGGLILGIALVIAGLLGVSAINSGNKIRIADNRVKESEQKVKASQTLVDKAIKDLENTNAQKEQVTQKLIQSQKDTEKKRIELVSATQNLGKLQNSLKSVTANRKNAEIRLKQAQELVIHARKNLANAEERESQMNQSLVKLQRNVLLANQKKSEAERLAIQAQATKAKAESDLAKAEIDRKKSAKELLKAQDALNKVQKEQQVIAENNKNVDELSKLIDDLYGNDKPEDEKQPEAAKDAIAQIGLSFTDFTDNKPEFKQALLKSSIALAYLRIDPLDKNKKAKTAINESIQVIESKPDLFTSDKGKPIAFFSYAVRGNLLEEKNPKVVPADYETAFRYAETPYRTAQNFDLTQDAVEESYNELLNPYVKSLNRDKFRALATASLKKHYDFRAKQALQALDPLLARKAWKEADGTTTEAILASIYSKNLDLSLKNLSCTSLQAMEKLWSKHSGGRFGFKAQKEIWVKTGNTLDGNYDEKTFVIFLNRIGWTDGKPELRRYIGYDTLFIENKSEKAPLGHLPLLWRRLRGSQSELPFILLSHCEL